MKTIIVRAANKCLINPNTANHPNNFRDIYGKLQFYVGCVLVCLCMTVHIYQKYIIARFI